VRNGYTERLLDADNNEIEDPVAYLEEHGLSVNQTSTKRRLELSISAPVQPSLKRPKVEVPSNGKAALFKADGTPVNNPVAFVAGIVRNGYTEPLLDADGNEIEDPVAYLKKHCLSVPHTSTNRRTDVSVALPASASGVLFKQDGTPVRDPVAYAEGIKRRGYNEVLLDAHGQQIRNPVAYVEKMVARTPGSGVPHSGKVGGVYSSIAASGNGPAVLFKSDGTPIRDPVAFVAGIEQRGYKEQIVDANGQIIRDPVAYVKAMQHREAGSQQHSVSLSAPPGAPAGAGKIFKQDGTAVRDPLAFVAGIERNGYTEPLFDAKGQQIRDPVAYVRAMK